MLHGTIEVNHVEIGAWSAVRKETVFTGMHRYQCEVRYRNNEGYPKHAEFVVCHYEKQGALALASLVISTAHKRMR